MKIELIHGQGYVRFELTAETEFEKLTLACIQNNAKWETVTIPDGAAPYGWHMNEPAPTKLSEIRLIHKYEKTPAAEAQ